MAGNFAWDFKKLALRCFFRETRFHLTDGEIVLGMREKEEDGVSNTRNISFILLVVVEILHFVLFKKNIYFYLHGNCNSIL